MTSTKSARIIKDCFGNNCVRLGGDEFSAVIKSFSDEEAAEAEKKFLSLMKKEGVSISFGSSVTNDLNEKSVEQMMVDADHMMYDRKRAFHANDKDKIDLN